MAKYGIQQITAPQFRTAKDCSVELRQRNVVAAYLVRMAMDVVIAGRTAGEFHADWWARFLRNITVSVKGEPKQSYTGQFLNVFARVFNDAGFGSYVNTDPADATDGTKSVVAYIPIPQQMPWCRPEQAETFGLPTAAVELPELILTTGQGADMLDGDFDGTAEVQNGEFTLYELPYIDPKLPPLAFQAMEVITEEFEVIQSGKIQRQLQGLLPGHELRALFIETFSGGAGGVGLQYDNALVDDLKLTINGVPVVERVGFDVLQQINKADYGLASLSDLTGVVVIDAAEDKNVGNRIVNGNGQVIGTEPELYAIRGRERPFLDLNVTKQAGECWVRVTTVYLDRGAR